MKCVLLRHWPFLSSQVPWIWCQIRNLFCTSTSSKNLEHFFFFQKYPSPLLIKWLVPKSNLNCLKKKTWHDYPGRALKIWRILLLFVLRKRNSFKNSWLERYWKYLLEVLANLRKHNTVNHHNCYWHVYPIYKHFHLTLTYITLAYEHAANEYCEDVYEIIYMYLNPLVLSSITILLRKYVGFFSEKEVKFPKKALHTPQMCFVKNLTIQTFFMKNIFDTSKKRNNNENLFFCSQHGSK